MLRHFFLGFTALYLSTASLADNLSEHTLANGLQVYVKVDKRAPVVVSQVWYKVGSAYEVPGNSGIAHAMEHMMFKGSKNYPNSEFMDIISKNGGQLNAFTTRDFTVFYEELAADKLAVSFELEADRMQNLTLAPETFDSEIKVVMEERRLRVDDDPESMLLERVHASSNIADPYHHDPIGWMNDLQNMNIMDIRQFYSTWYTPNNAFIVVVGNVKPKAVFKLAEKYFGSIKGHQIPYLKPQSPPPFLGMQTVTVNAPAKLPLLIMSYNTPKAVTDTQAAWEPYALVVLAGILDGGSSARLENDLVRGQQLVSSIGINYDPHTLFADSLMIAANPSQGHTVQEVQAAITKEIALLQTTTVSSDELERVKTGIVAQHVYDQDDLSTQATNLGSVIAVGLPSETADDYVNKIEAITADQVQQVAQRYLIENRLTVGILNPLPTTDTALPAGSVTSGGSHGIS